MRLFSRPCAVAFKVSIAAESSAMGVRSGLEKRVCGFGDPSGPDAGGQGRGRPLPLARLEPRVGFVDHVDPALATHQLAVAMAGLQRLERTSDLHGDVVSATEG